MTKFTKANRLFETYRAAQHSRQARAALGQLSDHMLRDIGLMRSDLFR